MEYDICEEYVQIIKSKIKLGEYKNAIASANKVLDYNPEFSMAYYLRGICFYAVGDYINSVSDYGYATVFDNQFAKAFFNMGVAKYKLRQFQDAIKDIRKAYDLFMSKNDKISADKCLEGINIIEREQD